jgi:Fe-S-cluster-containing dehydrogenase component
VKEDEQWESITAIPKPRAIECAACGIECPEDAYAYNPTGRVERYRICYTCGKPGGSAELSARITAGIAAGYNVVRS